MSEKLLVSTSTYLLIYRLLKEIGFIRYGVDGKPNIKILLERSSLVSTRLDYLQSIHKYRKSGRSIIFVEETYINLVQKAEEDVEVFHNTNQGGIIVLHACDSKGFINGALLIMKSKFTRKNYLKDMNYKNFSRWVKEKLLPNIPPKSVTVMKHTSYSSDAVKPTYKATKTEFKDWLKKNNIPFDESSPKSDLLVLVNNHQFSGGSELNAIIENNGHDILRIPALHTDLNPIEWIYRNAKKRHWNAEQLIASIDFKRKALELSLTECSKIEWQECHDRVKALELEYHKYDDKRERDTEEMLKEIEDQASDDEQDSDSQEDMEISDEDD